jgi:hypothetical protein
MFLLESGAEEGWGMTQTSGSITSVRHYTGKIELRNEQATQVRIYNVSFDTPVKVQYTRTETETAENSKKHKSQGVVAVHSSSAYCVVVRRTCLSAVRKP